MSFPHYEVHYISDVGWSSSSCHVVEPRAICVLISSTQSPQLSTHFKQGRDCDPDMREERNWLAAEAYPQIKEFCNEELDMDFQVVDMRWGVTDDATNEHITEDLCLAEIAKCQRTSFGPNFVVVTWLSLTFGLSCNTYLLIAFSKRNDE